MKRTQVLLSLILSTTLILPLVASANFAGVSREAGRLFSELIDLGRTLVTRPAGQRLENELNTGGYFLYRNGWRNGLGERGALSYATKSADEIFRYSVKNVETMTNETSRLKAHLTLQLGRVLRNLDSTHNLKDEVLADLIPKAKAAANSIQSSHRGRSEGAINELSSLIKKAIEKARFTKILVGNDEAPQYFARMEIDLPLDRLQTDDLDLIHNAFTRIIGKNLNDAEDALRL